MSTIPDPDPAAIEYAIKCGEEITRVRTESFTSLAEIVVEIGPDDLPGVAEVWGCKIVRHEQAKSWLPRAYMKPIEPF